jgi:hypothetical protein
MPCKLACSLLIGVSILVLGMTLATAQTTNSNTATATGTTTVVKKAKSNDPKEITPVVAEQPVPANPFQFSIGIPAWSSAIEGTTGIKGVSGHIDVPFSTLWDHVSMVVPLAMDAHYGKWGFHVDGQYVKLTEHFQTDEILFSSGNLTMEQAFANFNLNYQVLDTERWNVETSIGGRYNYLSLAGSLQSKHILVPSHDESGNISWVDPILGTNATVHIYKPFSLQFLGDVGGFGVGSHITYQFYGGGKIQIARYFYSELGYRYLYTDYSSGGNVYDVAMKGPQITFGANF